MKISDIAIAILNYNGEKLLENFLPTAIKHSKGAQIYIIDNASTDNSVKYVRDNFPQVNVISFSENMGYSAGYNRAVEQMNSKIICFLNSDVEVTPSWLSEMLSLFEKDSNLAIVQPKILDHNRRTHFEYAGAAGGYLDVFGYPYCRGRNFEDIEEDKGQYDNEVEIFWCTGACMFVRKHLFEELGGFDELYFAYQEEIDFCWRVKSEGYSIRYTQKSVVYHVGKVTLNNSPYNTFLNFRNSLFTLVKNLPMVDILPIIFSRLCLDFVAGIYFLSKWKIAHIEAIVKAHISFYNHFSVLIKKRKTNQNKHLKYYQKTSVFYDYLLNKMGITSKN